MLEMPTVIKDPQKPIGTHTSTRPERAGASAGWLGVGLTEFRAAVMPLLVEVMDRVEIPRGRSEL